MPRKKPTRSYTMSNRDHAEHIEMQLPYPTKDDVIDTASGLILYALKKLPRKR